MPLDPKYQTKYKATTDEGIKATDKASVLQDYSTFQGYLKDGAPPLYKYKTDEVQNFRILPRLNIKPGEAAHFMYPVAIHFFKHVQASCVCPAKKYGQCGSCERNKYIAFAEGGPKDTAAAATYRVSPSYLCYGVDMTKMSEGPKLWNVTPTLKELIEASMKDLTTGKTLEIDHPLLGNNLAFVKKDTGQKFNNGNAVIEISTIQPQPASALPEQFMNQWLAYVDEHPIESWLLDTTPEEVIKIAKLDAASVTEEKQNFMSMAAGVLNKQATLTNPPTGQAQPAQEPPKQEPTVQTNPSSTEFPKQEATAAPAVATDATAQTASPDGATANVPETPPTPPDDVKPSAVESGKSAKKDKLMADIAAKRAANAAKSAAK